MRFLNDPRFREARFGACLLGLLSFSLLAGCGGGGGGSNGNPGGGTTTTTGTSTSGTNTGGTNTGGQTALSVTVKTSTGLTASLLEASGTVSVGGTLVYTETLANNTPNAITINTTANPDANPPVSPTTPSAGLVVRNAAGTSVFEPIPGSAPVFLQKLQPGETLTSTVVASGFTTAGTYSATATFSDDTTAAATVGPLTVTAQ